MNRTMNYENLSRLTYQVLKEYYLKERVDEKSTRYLLSILNSEVDFFKYNKLLAAIGVMCSNIYSKCTHDLLVYRSTRLRKYYEEVFRIASLFEQAGIEYVVIKTYSIFPKDISDIDILVRSKSDQFGAEEVLKRENYVRRKRSSEQHLWSIKRENVVIDIEIHTNIAVSQFEYYPKGEIFKNSVRINHVRVPSPIDDALLGVSHCVVKDLYITLSDVIQISLTIIEHGVDPIDLIAKSKRIGVFIPLLFYVNVLRSFDYDLYVRFNKILGNNLLNLLSKGRLKEFPMRPGLHTVMASYVDLTLKKLKREPIGKVVSELLSLPQSRGIDGLIKYLTLSKPPIKEVVE